MRFFFLNELTTEINKRKNINTDKVNTVKHGSFDRTLKSY